MSDEKLRIYVLELIYIYLVFILSSGFSVLRRGAVNSILTHSSIFRNMLAAKSAIFL